MQKAEYQLQIKAPLQRYRCSGDQQRECMKILTFREEEGKKDSAREL